MAGFICSVPVLSGLLTSCLAPPPLANGYVEGDYVLIAPVEIARIEELKVARGDRVSAGTLLVRLEEADAAIQLAQAKAALRQAESQLANLREGRRPEEIAVIEASLTAARAQADEANRVFTRQTGLRDRGIAPQAAYDQAKSALDQANAQVAQFSANLAVARLAARPAEIAAAQAAVDQARAAVDNAGWRLNKRRLLAPAPGQVTDIIRRAGELGGPSQPVLSFLPDGAVKLRLYVGETNLSSLSTGASLTVHCDGCGEGLNATVTYVSDTPEFTPPVIYSLENRQKLVYLVEARPNDKAARLKPGQIIDVELAGETP